MGRPFARMPYYVRPQISKRLLRIEFNLEKKSLFLLATADRQHAMGGNLLGRLAIIRVHRELAFGIVCPLDRLAYDEAFIQHQLAEMLAELGCFANPFRDDMAG